MDEILDAAVRRDARFLAIHQPNLGVSAARNRALKRTCGEWILFLDGDDVFHPLLLRGVAQAIETGPTDLDAIRFWATVGDERSVPFAPYPDPAQPAQRLVTLGAEGSPEDYAALYGALWEVAYHRRVVDGLCFDVTLRYGEDLLFLLRAITRVRKAIIQTWKPYGLRLRPGSAMRSAVTERRVSDGIAFGAAAFATIAGTPLARNVTFVRLLYGSVVERCAVEIWEQSNRRKLWARWLEALSAIRGMKAAFSLWQRMVLRIVTETKWPWVAWFLCVVPCRIKRRVNRQRLLVWWARVWS